MSEAGEASERRRRRRSRLRPWIRVAVASTLVVVLGYAAGVVWDYTRPGPAPVPGHGPVSTQDHPSRVAIGHRDEDPEQHPHKWCAGTLIAPDAVLTAGHCIRRYDAEEFQVTAGRDDLRSEEGHTVDVVEKWVDPGFADGRQTIVGGLVRTDHKAPGDIGVLLLEEELPYDTLPMAAADDPPLTGGETTELLGWRVSPEDAPVLWRSPSRIESDDECVRRADRTRSFAPPPTMHGMSYDTDSYLCAGADGFAATIRGTDSGTSLVVDGRIVGVLAWTLPSEATAPAFYTRVATYEEAIARFLDEADR